MCHYLQAKREELRAHISNCYRQTARKEHQNVLMRRHIIEERKEELENLNEAKVSFVSLNRSLEFLESTNSYTA